MYYRHVGVSECECKELFFFSLSSGVRAAVGIIVFCIPYSVCHFNLFLSICVYIVMCGDNNNSSFFFLFFLLYFIYDFDFARLLYVSGDCNFL